MLIAIGKKYIIGLNYLFTLPFVTRSLSPSDLINGRGQRRCLIFDQLNTRVANYVELNIYRI